MMKMKKFMQIMALLLVVFSVLSLTACKKYHMSEEEIIRSLDIRGRIFWGGGLSSQRWSRLFGKIRSVP